MHEPVRLCLTYVFVYRRHLYIKLKTIKHKMLPLSYVQLNIECLQPLNLQLCKKMEQRGITNSPVRCTHP